MNKKDILKLIIISIILLICMLTILIILGKTYITSHTKIKNMDLQQIATNSEPTTLPTNENTVDETSIPIMQQPEDVNQEIEYQKDKYYIKVNNQMNTVTIYTKNENGEYTKPIKAMICSTGEKTPQNSKYILPSKRWEWRLLFGDVYGKYTTHISGHILFHSVPYLKKSSDTLKYDEYDKLGTSASAGCVRLTVEDAKWIYDKCLTGSIVEFYNSPDPGPLGKPTAMKISDYKEYRNWDPTDPDENNPWNNIL